MLKLLQQNAEWMCAIAIVIFTAVQVRLYYIQIKQNLQLKRLELAQKLDEKCKDFPATVKEVREIISFLNANRSLFITLLNQKDIVHYCNLYRLMSVFNSNKVYPIEEASQHIKIFMQHIDALSSALCNANYGLSQYKLKNPFGDENVEKTDKSKKRNENE